MPISFPCGQQLNRKSIHSKKPATSNQQVFLRPRLSEATIHMHQRTINRSAKYAIKSKAKHWNKNNPCRIDLLNQQLSKR
jgi:hypothetical protein